MTTYSAVRTTGIYCRPGCGAKPLAENVRTFELAASAEAAGYRACLRCRPYRVAGTVPDDAPELVCRAVRLIIDGMLDGATEDAVGARLGLSARHLRRLFRDHLGVTPDGFARSRRAHFARRLLDDSDLGIAEVAFASGFGSLRQFNRAMREVFKAAPGELRARRRKADRLVADGGLPLRLPFAPSYDWPAVLAELRAGEVPGVESIVDDTYRRTITLDGDPGLLEIGPGGADHLLLRAHLPHWEGVIHVVERAARLVGIDSGTPGAWAPLEIAVNAVAEDTAALVRRHGAPVAGLGFGLTHAFPAAEPLAAEPGVVGDLARAVLDGRLRLEEASPAELVAAGVPAPAAQRIARRLTATGR
ncbi:helix-turn-helix domain-containing protein [Kutzneria sp. NPDC052558]|uniref:helix-turn-helix domain-containing protein n=1 Tax=Kutzneria sp. NPDC052558 TaxID=3364121 RepID=UPI0037CA0AD2